MALVIWNTTPPDKHLAALQRFAVHCRAMNRIHDRNGAARILGIDPAAVGPTGYGIVEKVGRICKVLHFGALRVDARERKQASGAALHKVHALLCHLIEEFSPTAIAVESVFTALNMRTALRLAEVRGVVLLAAAQHGIPAYSYSPREVKASLTGYGQADKRQMQSMVRALLSMPEVPEPPDAADALAVALCHLHAEHARLRLGLPENGPAARKGTIPASATLTPRRVTPPPLTRIESVR